jgi:hypothetical protein
VNSKFRIFNLLADSYGWTDERPFPGMCPDMRGQIGELLEGLLANITLVMHFTVSLL